MSGFRFAPPAPPRRRAALTPMIDVVFLLLVFFMLAARFGAEGALPAAAAGAGAEWRGPPRLVEIAPDGLRLNGAEIAEAALPAALRPLMTGEGDPVILRALAGASLQRVIDVADALRAAGFGALVLAE